MTRTMTWCVGLLALSLVSVGAGCKKSSATTEPAADVPSATPVAAAPAASAATPAPKKEPPTFTTGQKINIEWHGKSWPGVITQVVAKDRYKIHYDNYGNEWDEVIGPNRILGKR